MKAHDQLMDVIRQDGFISVANYTALNNAHYYTTRDPLGAAGDFITSPEISQMFGELIGAWCIETWHQLEKPDPFLLVELGPGRGTLMADILRIAKLDPEFNAALNIHLVETSPVLKSAQQDRLKDFNVMWHDTIETLPDEPLIVIANEFFDALKLEQWVKKDASWHQRVIQEKEAQLVFGTGEETREFPFDAPDGSIAETCPEAENIIRQLSLRIDRAGGAALIIDYGHTKSFYGDTLQAMKQHKHTSIFSHYGECDLTFHVDFDALKRVALAGNLSVAGPVTQRHFLEKLGINLRAAKLMQEKDEAVQNRIESEALRLTDPNGMGQLFKAMAISSIEASLAGF